MTARQIVLVIATVLTGIGLVLIVGLELSGAAERRRGGVARDVVEVLLPIVATVVLLGAAWVY